uniref:BHP1 protein n=1 Tax=Suberites domuncula TaxID=55567 RepID=Q9N754_SUBDO|nr:BHP1 protein [Suberites domuncula]
MAEALLTTISMTHPDNDSELILVMQQSACLSYHLTYYLLNQGGIKLNGYAGNGRTSHTRNRLTNDKKFREAISTLESSCKQMKSKYQQEIEGLVKTLDISDTQLYTNFQHAANSLMDGDIRWGRIAVLFFFTSVLAKRLHKDGHSHQISSLIGWLTTFLNDNATSWILENGGWAAIKDSVNVEEKQQPPTVEKAQKSSWLTIAAVGVGAVVVGALAIR